MDCIFLTQYLFGKHGIHKNQNVIVSFQGLYYFLNDLQKTINHREVKLYVLFPIEHFEPDKNKYLIAVRKSIFIINGFSTYHNLAGALEGDLYVTKCDGITPLFDRCRKEINENGRAIISFSEFFSYPHVICFSARLGEDADTLLRSNKAIEYINNLKDMSVSEQESNKIKGLFNI